MKFKQHTTTILLAAAMMMNSIEGVAQAQSDNPFLKSYLKASSPNISYLLLKRVLLLKMLQYEPLK
jgi:hypothetical protein